MSQCNFLEYKSGLFYEKYLCPFVIQKKEVQ